MYTFEQTYLTPQNGMPTIKKAKTFSETIFELNKEFDESIYFNHHYTALRKLSVEKPISSVTIPFLMDKEFLFSYFEEKMITKEADKETITQILGHIKQFSSSNDLTFIRNFLDNIKTYAEIIGIKNTSDILVPALAKIVDLSLNVKIKFLESLLPFIDYLCSNGDEGINILKNSMFNILQELYSQKKEEYTGQMKKLLFKNFVKIAKNIVPYDTDQSILNIIIAFGNEDNVRSNMKKNKVEDTKNLKFDEHKILCIRYIRNLAEGIGKNNTERYLLPILISFSVETNIEIKKELLITLPIVSEIISADYISSKVYDILRRISIDLNPDLRKVCIISIAKVIKIFKTKCQEIKNIKKDDKKYSAKNFVNLVENLSKDKELNVQYKIIEKIGEIIAPLDKDELSIELFQFYRNLCKFLYKTKITKNPLGATLQEFNNPILNKMKYTGQTTRGTPIGPYAYLNDEDSSDFNEIMNMEHDFHKQLSEKELSYYFAYNFPAILFCYGNKYWPDLKDIYYDFCFEEDLAIRLSIIASFHEIANIVGKEITQNELLPIYDKFLESIDNYEQKLAIKNLPQILIKVDKSVKERYYKYFEPVSIFIDNTGNKVRNFNFMNWKNKLNVIEGILCYYNLYDNDVIYKSILPQCITFALDKFYKVRKTSSRVLASILLYLYHQDYKKDKIIQTIKNFAFNKKFKIRINFIKFLPVFLQDKDFYENEIKNLIKIIVLKDKIMDVKIALAKVLKKIIGNEKEVLYNDIDIHKFCVNLNENKIISKIFDGVKIKDTTKVDDNLEEKKYFVEENKYFFEEFKIELEKKDNNNVNKIINDVNKIEIEKEEMINEKIENKINEVKKEEPKEKLNDNKELKKDEQRKDKDNKVDKKDNKEIKNEEKKIEVKEENKVEEPKKGEHKEEKPKKVENKVEEPKKEENKEEKKEIIENKEEKKEIKEVKEEPKEEEHKKEEDKKESKNEEIQKENEKINEEKKDDKKKEEPKEEAQKDENKIKEEKEKPKEHEETKVEDKKEEEKKVNEDTKKENIEEKKEINNETQNQEDNKKETEEKENEKEEEKEEEKENNENETKQEGEGEKEKKENNKRKKRKKKK